MNALTVRELMTSPPITIGPQTRLPRIKSIMRERYIRRVLVVQDDRLLGIVTLGDVRNAFPSDASALSIYELSYLLDRVTAADIMRAGVITIEADMPVSEAARIMLTQKISGIPVLQSGRLVGIITESDIFRAVVNGALPVAAPSSRSHVGHAPLTTAL